MRSIKKRAQPAALTQWRLPRLLPNRGPGNECDYNSLRRFPKVVEAVEDGVLAEQGGICAYTGHCISITPANKKRGIHRDVDFHIEHLTPQDYCNETFGNYGKDTDYPNLVACWPRPNCGFQPAYGAKKKDNWPAPAEQNDFISPLRPDCSARFRFNHRGEMEPAKADDKAAELTIEKLGLQHGTLKELRRAAIRGALNPASRQIKLTEARKLLTKMTQAMLALDRGDAVTLLPFCFAIEPALRREIRKLEGIMSQS
jgi:uncharacterized protein (TIGR02646 family)